MSDAMEVLQWHENALTEYRPAPPELNDSDRIEWMKERCNMFKYVEPTPANLGYFMVTDCHGQVTIEPNFLDAIDRAHDKWKQVNE